MLGPGGRGPDEIRALGAFCARREAPDRKWLQSLYDLLKQS